MDLFRKIFYPIESTVYFILLVLAITTVAGSTHYWDATQATTIIIAAATGMVGIWCPPLVEKLFKLNFSHLIDIIIAVDLFAAVVLGEACTFYYRFQGMDKFFHFFATAELALGGYVVAKYILAKTNKGTHQVALALVFGFFFAVAFEAAWEVYEFAYDTLAGTNMQKYIPPEYYELLDEDGNLTLSMEEIANFYRTFEGYHYALDDTMYDILADVGGGLFGCLSCAVVFHFYPQLQDKIIYRPVENEVLYGEEEKTADRKNN